MIRHRFEWADEYFAASVSDLMLNRVRTDIENQEEHHKKVTFMQEYPELTKRYGFGLQG